MSDGASTRPNSARPAPLFERGDALDHFIVLDPLGEGGMGVVWSAYDPDLHRKVAVKLLPPGAPDADQKTSRLFREAQAMAKLSHPNVATVYEVGVVDDQVFIAMELIEGDTLDEWLAAEPRAPADIVNVFVSAGEGLAAAHAAGIIHRDFKPANVMIARDGRVVVLDFGVARPAPGSEAERDDLDDVRRDPSDALDTALTRAGTVVGTPAYMSPEQYLGQAVDERSDQFSFCVSLFKALYGERPFGGDTIAELSSAVVEGRVADPPAARDVPARLRRLLERGLQRTRADRFESMSALLAELRPRPPVASTRMTIALGAVVLAALITIVVLLRRDGAGDRCASADNHLAGVWDDGRKAAVLDGFEATGRTYAQPTYHTVEAALDAYTREWVAMRTEACEATDRGEQSELLLDRRMQCLDRRLAAVGALVGVFADHPAGTVVDEAVSAVASLPPLEPCSDADALTAAVALPDGDIERAEVAEIRALIDRANAINVSGDPAAARAALEPALSRADATGYAPVRAEAQLALGDITDSLDDLAAAEVALRAAVELAAESHQDDVASRAWTLLLNVLSEAGSNDEAVALVPVARAMLVRTDAPARERARFYILAGSVESRAGDYEKAKATQDMALAIAEAELPADGIEYQACLEAAGMARWQLGELDEARAMLERALELQRTIVQPRHPDVAATLNNLGLVLAKQGDNEAALAMYTEAIEIVTEVFGPDHVRLAKLYINSGYALSRLQQLDRALEHHERSVELSLAAYGPDHPDVARAYEGLGSVLWNKGDYAAATTAYEHTLSIREHTLASDHPLIARTINNLGGLLATQGKLEDALAMFRRALEVRQSRLGPNHPDIAASLTDIGNCLVDLGRPSEATEPLERALRIRREAGISPVRIADTESLLAISLWSGGDRTRAAELARKARTTYRAAGGRTNIDLLETWMRQVGID